MKILVLGHSDSEGSRLQDLHDAWPYLVQRRLEAALGVQVEVAHKLLFAGPTALAYAERQVEAYQPDIVFVGTSAYAVVVQLASNRVRARWGNRAANFMNSWERRVAHWQQHLGPRGNRVLTTGRKSVRKVLGTAPAYTFEQVVDCYHSIFDSLARPEDIHTIVFGGLGYGRELQLLNPRLNEMQDRFHALLKARADEHHFDWVTHESILGGCEAKLAYMQPDGTHSNAEAHRLAAEAVYPLVAAKV